MTARFLSTLSLRRATLHCTTYLNCSLFLSTLSLRRATNSSYGALDGASISIHALLAESDFGPISAGFIGGLFLSTLSLRRATRQNYECFKWIKFLSTLSLRRATAIDVFLAVWAIISIHALLAESDVKDRPRPSAGIYDFYPRSPCGERPLVQIIISGYARISIHALLAESDSPCVGWLQIVYNFYPRSPCGERLAGPSGPALLFNFYPRSPCGERLFC